MISNALFLLLDVELGARLKLPYFSQPPLSKSIVHNRAAEVPIQNHHII